MSDQRSTTAEPGGRASPVAAPSRAAEHRRHRLFAALDLSWDQPFEAAVQAAGGGGALDFGVRNTGLSPAFQGYVEVVRVLYRLRPPLGRGIFVFEQPPGAPSFWRRGRRGEVLAPDARVAAPPSATPGTQGTIGEQDMAFPETLASTDPQDRRSTLLARTWTGTLAPRAATTMQVVVESSDDLGLEPEGIWSWCLVARCFDLLQEPPVDVALPTPPQPPHHTRLMCLHDTLD